MGEKQGRRKTFLYTVARGLMVCLTRTLTPVRYEGAERLNQPGPWILVSNHISAWDPLVLSYPVKCQEVVFLGKKELVSNPFTAWLLKKLHMIAVSRGSTDMEAMRACMRALREGEVLGIFPEGTRHHEGTMTEFESGVALIALRSGAPIRPVYISRRLRLFRVTHVKVGGDIPMDDLRAEGISQDTIAKLMQRIRDAYAALTGGDVKKD